MVKTGPGESIHSNSNAGTRLARLNERITSLINHTNYVYFGV